MSSEPAEPCSPPSAERPGARPAAWRWSSLLEDPHRIAFLTAMTTLMIASVWWAVVLVWRAFDPVPAPFVLASGLTHAFVMTGSFMPMFFAGFLYTVGPRWLRVATIDGRALRLPCAGWLTGWIVFIIGAQSALGIAASGLALVTIAWSAIVFRLLRMAATSARADRVHFLVITWACAIGAAGFAGASIALAVGSPAWLVPIESALIGLFIAPVFAAALHRMVPLVHVAWPTIEERFENAPLYLLIAAFALDALARMAVALVDAGFVTIIAFSYTFVVDSAMAIVLFQLSWRWRTGQNMRIRLLAMFLCALIWLALAFALHAAEALAVLTSSDLPGLRLAGLHALTMGFFASVMMAMVSRVTCGQAGRTFASEHLVWRLFLVLQAATATRVLAEVPLGGAQTPLRVVAVAVLLWCVAMLGWCIRYIGWYGRPRVIRHNARAAGGTRHPDDPRRPAMMSAHGAHRAGAGSAHADGTLDSHDRPQGSKPSSGNR